MDLNLSPVDTRVSLLHDLQTKDVGVTVLGIALLSIVM